MKLNYLLVIVLVFSFTLVSSQLADLGTTKLGNEFTFSQFCDDATYITLSSIKTPSGIVNVDTNMTATNSGEYTYNYTPMAIGRYDFRGISDGCENTFSTYIMVTYTGLSLEMPQTVMYIVILFFLIGILGYIIYIYPRLPQNATNDDGYVINATQLAYLRPIALGIMWILILSITYIVSNIAIAYIQAGFLGNFIFGIWKIMMTANFLIIPLWIIYMINDAFKQAKLKEFLERGGNDFQ